MKTLIVVSHPRKDSLTMQVAHAILEGVSSTDKEVEILDLYAEDFNPVTFVKDEADYSNIDKKYSAFVEKEIERLKGVDDLIFVFPVYWHSLPAMIKGYIDRVFNYGFAYGGGNHLPVKRIRWIPLAGDTLAKYEKRGYKTNMENQFNIGIADFVGVKNSSVDFIWDSLGLDVDENHRDEYYKGVISNAYLYGQRL